MLCISLTVKLPSHYVGMLHTIMGLWRVFFFKTHQVKDDNWPLTQNIVGALLTREWFDMMDEV